MDMEQKQTVKSFLENKVASLHAMVIGDVMLDRYFYGDVSRISPEAPVPVNAVDKKQDTLGGAANVAHNLARLGCQTYLAGFIGDDHHGRLLLRKMKEFGIDGSSLVKGREKTTTKIRILGGHQQMLRLDFEETTPISEAAAEQLLERLREHLRSGLDVVIISDYHKGVCNEQVCQNAITMAHEAGIPVFVDPKGVKWQCYSGADYITPNVKETGVMIGKSLENEDEVLRSAAQAITDQYRIPHVVITRSEKGMSIFEPEGETHIRTVAKEVFDVSGAGDTVIATLAAGIAGHLPSHDAANLANFAAGIGVGHVGTYAVSREEILEVL